MGNYSYSTLESKESVETDGGHVYAVTKTQRSENIGDSNELLAKKKLTLKLLKLRMISFL